ncbi:hypothetical protein GE253_19325 [Niveispirillum sp. SYP-B3756]|uniref:hypothetical protein n=1 Tax=Niveispirillum sp. SYP-B3756 TaxID=2662178 RepID=UPI0012921FA5|nr:hypothetical protein [Niveispirillum sp. SYP-B3756]MQP67483.1 hypothetical protein [Niveispirillum sp. SYP-B3756]
MITENTYRRSRIFQGLLAAGAISAAAVFPAMGVYESFDVFNRQGGWWEPDKALALLRLYAFTAGLSIPLTLMLGATIFALLIRRVALTPRRCAAVGGFLVPLPFAGFPDMGGIAGMIALAPIALIGAAAGLTFWRIVRIGPAGETAGPSA